VIAGDPMLPLIVSFIGILLLTALATLTIEKDRLIRQLTTITIPGSQNVFFHRIQILDVWSIVIAIAFICLGIAFNVFLVFFD
jgi:hypothetical protein